MRGHHPGSGPGQDRRLRTGASAQSGRGRASPLALGHHDIFHIIRKICGKRNGFLLYFTLMPHFKLKKGAKKLCILCKTGRRAFLISGYPQEAPGLSPSSGRPASSARRGPAPACAGADSPGCTPAARHPPGTPGTAPGRGCGEWSGAGRRRSRRPAYWSAASSCTR